MCTGVANTKQKAGAKVSLIAAVSTNLVIGKSYTLPWYIPEDLRRFKKLTTGHVIIMGKKTYQSIGKPLPDRINIVVTSKPEAFETTDVLIAVGSVQEALDIAKEKEKDEIFVIGGGEIFRQTIEVADKLYLTLIKKDIEGDVYFPDYSDFVKIDCLGEGESNGYKYKFLELER